MKKIFIYFNILLFSFLLLPTKTIAADNYTVNQNILLLDSEILKDKNNEISKLNMENKKLLKEYDSLILIKKNKMKELNSFNKEYEKIIEVEYKDIELNKSTIIFESFDYISQSDIHLDILDNKISKLQKTKKQILFNINNINKQIEDINNKIEEIKKSEEAKKPHLTKNAGIFYGPSGKETFYNLNMNGVINTMRNMGNTDEYWVREDGCKMLGEYIMVAANLSVHPRGSLVETSLGMGIVCDTGGFVSNGSGVALDIATTW